MGPAVHPEVARICATYLEVADRYATGLVEGLYLHGSVALRDYRPGVSDIDFVAVTGWVPDAEAVRLIHAELRRSCRRRPFFDGLYVGWHDLRQDPRQAADGPAVHEWRVDPRSRSERHLVTWHVLRQGGVAVRGPAGADLDVHTDWQALAEATRRNLDEYWRPWLDRSGRGVVGLSSWAVSWGALGATRLRHSIAAGQVTSKTAAAAYALDTYDERWHRIVQEALRIRVGGAPRYRNPWHRRSELVGFLTDVLAG